MLARRPSGKCRIMREGQESHASRRADCRKINICVCGVDEPDLGVWPRARLSLTSSAYLRVFLAHGRTFDAHSDHGVMQYNWGPHLPPQYGDGGGHAFLGAMAHPMGCWAMHDKIDGRIC